MAAACATGCDLDYTVRVTAAGDLPPGSIARYEVDALFKGVYLTPHERDALSSFLFNVKADDVREAADGVARRVLEEREAPDLRAVDAREHPQFVPHRPEAEQADPVLPLGHERQALLRAQVRPPPHDQVTLLEHVVRLVLERRPAPPGGRSSSSSGTAACSTPATGSRASGW